MEKPAEKFVIAQIKGKQYLAQEGSHLIIDRIPKEAGQTVIFKDVLLSRDKKEIKVGTPLVAGASIEAEIVANRRGPKGVAFRYRSKKRIRVSRGFRADLTELYVKKITN